MKPRTIIGLILIVAGAWKLANLWGIIENDWLWRQSWTAYIAPILLIYVGGAAIVNSYRRDPDQWLQRALPIGEDGKRISCSVHYGGDEYVYHGEPFHGARLDASAWICARLSLLRMRRLTFTPFVAVSSYMCPAMSTCW